MESTSRPLGGIAALKLGVVSLSEAASTLPNSGTVIPLLEDRSTYSQIASYIGGSVSVKHSLSVFTPIDYLLPEELVGGLNLGFEAYISFNSQREIIVGRSKDAGAHRALRLVSCTTNSGAKAASRGYKEWLFESIDGAESI